jgi:hypothetical protein
MTEEQILDEHPDLEKADFRASTSSSPTLAAARISIEPASRRKPLTATDSSPEVAVPKA